MPKICSYTHFNYSIKKLIDHCEVAHKNRVIAMTLPEA